MTNTCIISEGKTPVLANDPLIYLLIWVIIFGASLDKHHQIEKISVRGNNRPMKSEKPCLAISWQNN
jgi:hypothetical protein